LTAETFCAFADEFGIFDRRAVDGNFIGTRRQHHAHILDSANAAADRERNKNLRRTIFGDFDHCAATFVRSRNVQENKFVRPLQIVAFGKFDWVTGIAQSDKVRAFDDAPVLHVKAGDNSFRQHVQTSEALKLILISSAQINILPTIHRTNNIVFMNAKA
jgi:hypothetical protein